MLLQADAEHADVLATSKQEAGAQYQLRQSSWRPAQQHLENKPCTFRAPKMYTWLDRHVDGPKYSVDPNARVSICDVFSEAAVRSITSNISLHHR